MSVSLNRVMQFIVGNGDNVSLEQLRKSYRKHQFDPEINSFVFRTKARHKLTINANLLFNNTDLSVTIVDENDKYYTVVTFDGLQLDFPKELAEINDLEIENGKILFPESIYDNWCVKKDKTVDSFRNRFINGMEAILDNKDIILRNPKYFLIKVPNLFYFYSKRVCIGEWLENLDVFTGGMSTENKQKRERHENCVVVSMCGSLLNDIHASTCWCRDVKKVLYGHTWKYNTIRTYSFDGGLRYLPLKSNRMHSLMLLHELGI